MHNTIYYSNLSLENMNDSVFIGQSRAMHLENIQQNQHLKDNLFSSKEINIDKS